MRETTDELLKHYAAHKEPQTFFQIDGWFGGKHAGDPVVATDEKGYSMTGGVTSELMHGADVRIFIAPSTPVSEAVELLRQAADWLDRDPDMVQYLLESRNPNMLEYLNKNGR